MNMNFKNKKNLLFCLFTCVTIVILIMASDLVVAMFLPSDFVAKKVDIDEYSEIDNEAICIVKDECEIGDIFEKYVIRGAAFCEMEAGSDNNNRTIELFLVSDKYSYKIVGGSAIRVDVYHELEGEKSMANGNIGFQTTFSTINIHNGTYELMAYVCENDEVRGFASFNVYYDKDKNGFRRHE